MKAAGHRRTPEQGPHNPERAFFLPTCPARRRHFLGTLPLPADREAAGALRWSEVWGLARSSATTPPGLRGMGDIPLCTSHPTRGLGSSKASVGHWETRRANGVLTS